MFSLTMLAAKTVTSAASASDDVRSSLANQVAGFFEFLISRVPAWIAGFVVFVLSFFAAKMAKAAVESRMESHVDEEHQDLLILAGRVTYYGTLTVGIFVALKIAGVDLTAVLAAIAFGIGFALRDLIMNFLSGVLVIVSRQFTIGDFIKVGDTVGKVMEIQTRATILKAVDGTRVIVPNAELFTSQVVSMTSNPLRRVVVPIYVSYDTDITYAAKIAMEVMKKHPKVQKKPAPSVIVKDYGDSTIDLAGRFWCGSRDGWFKVRSEIMHQMWSAFQAAGIVVPYNIMHVETAQDTAEYEKESAVTAKKRMGEMKLSKAISESAAPSAGVPEEGAVNGAGSGIATLVPATVAVAVEPEGAYADQTEIDGQA